MSKWHRRHVPELNETINTDRFVLRPLGLRQAWSLDRRIGADVELTYLIDGAVAKPKLRKPFRHLLRPNGRSRFVFAISAPTNAGDRADQIIGAHTVALRPFRNAHLGVIIMDRNWWGNDVVTEVRQALMRHFVTHAGVSQFLGTVRVRNAASVANYIRLGFEQTGIRYQAGWDDTRQEPIDWFDFSLRGAALDALLVEDRAP